MRTVSPTLQAVLEGGHVPHALLVEMQFDSGTVYVATGGINITWSGHTWLAVGGLGAIDELKDVAGEAPGLRFALTGVPSSQIALALAEPVRNRPILLRNVWLDPAGTGEVLDVMLVWTGTLDNLTLTHSAEGVVTVGVTAEHAGATLRRAKPLRYTDADQQKLYPGDTCLRFLPSQANHQDVWPSAAWGRK